MQLQLAKNHHHNQGERQNRIICFLQDTENNCKASVSENMKKHFGIQQSAKVMEVLLPICGAAAYYTYWKARVRKTD